MNRLHPLVALVASLAFVAPVAAQSTAEALPTLQRLEYERVIEWAGDHVQLRLVVERQADGSYRVETGGEDHLTQVDLPASEADLSDVRKALHGMRNFGGDSFAGDGHHWYTNLKAQFVAASGAPIEVDIMFFDMDDSRASELAAALEGAAEALIAKLTPSAPPSGGMLSAIPN